jgi:carbon-monoxide dehydrogenase large subunit
VIRYLVVHDSGREINPMLVEGQLHGGVAHGIGYALFEQAIFAADGAFQTATWLDYAIPSAPDIGFEPLIVSRGVEARSNPQGIKGVGEAGTIPAVAAVTAAVEQGVRQLVPSAVLSEVPIDAQLIRGLVARSQGTVR